MIDKAAFAWPQDCRGAVSLTYDDALPCHWELVAPALEAQGLRGTFYTNILSAAAAPEAWRRIAGRGHELGNHSIFHPCRKNLERPRAWLPDEYDLRGYTPRRWVTSVPTVALWTSCVRKSTAPWNRATGSSI